MNCTKCEKFLSKSDVILHHSEELYECTYCNHKFCINESMDYEWEKWIDSFSEKITKDYCISWILGDTLDKKNIEKELSADEFVIKRYVYRYFGISSDCIDLKQFKRNLIIESILEY
jgi:DNA-directed RNA polymerase subunit RPC12/RpoP